MCIYKGCDGHGIALLRVTLHARTICDIPGTVLLCVFVPQEWRCLFETLPKEWMESVQLVLDYFCERTPRR